MTPEIDPELVPGLAGALTAHLPDGMLDVATVRTIDDRLRVETAPAVRPGGHAGPRPAAAGARAAARRRLPAVDPRRRDVPRQRPHRGRVLRRPRRAAAACPWSRWTTGSRRSSRTPRRCTTAGPRSPGAPQRSTRVVVAGGSAGGGLAAALCLLTRDEGGPPIAAAHLYYPMLDDRRDTPSARTDSARVERRLGDLAWASYLGGRPADALAAPARAADLRGLPPMYVDTGELDMFRDEDAAFAARLARPGSRSGSTWCPAQCTRSTSSPQTPRSAGPPANAG